MKAVHIFNLNNEFDRDEYRIHVKALEWALVVNGIHNKLFYANDNGIPCFKTPEDAIEWALDQLNELIEHYEISLNDIP